MASLIGFTVLQLYEGVETNLWLYIRTIHKRRPIRRGEGGGQGFCDKLSKCG